MRIAFFTDTYLPNKDGVVVSLLNLKKELEKKHKVYIFTPSPDGVERYEEGIFYFKSAPFPPYPQYRISFPNFPKVVEMAKDLEIDLLHNHGIALTSWACLAASKALKIPSITTFHTDIAKTTHYISENIFVEKISSKLAWKYLKFLYSKFDLVTAPSKFAVAQLKRIGINSIYLPNGIKLSNFKTSKKRENYLLHVGRLVKEKEVDFIFPCIKKYNSSNRDKIHLKIIGRGPAEDYYKEKAKEYGIEEFVEFLGFVPNKELAKIYSRARATLFLSTFDTQGLVVLESLASGVPVIYRNNTAAAEISKKLKLGFSRCSSFEKAYRRSKKIKSKECREIAKSYDIKKVVKKLLHLYKFISQ